MEVYQVMSGFMSIAHLVDGSSWVLILMVKVQVISQENLCHYLRMEQEWLLELGIMMRMEVIQVMSGFMNIAHLVDGPSWVLIWMGKQQVMCLG
mmetsp:Transcript_108235/g.220995  ORF Transcript_108235/g.220995 Transcript_108235/m.220995 type:complete len:94 (-) Transcript_108235:110-391(-)